MYQIQIDTSMYHGAISLRRTCDEEGLVIPKNRIKPSTVKNASIASILFKSCFIDFDPVKAKAAGREPEGLSQEIAELFPETFVESSLGKIPSGWKVGKVQQFQLSIF